MGNVNFEVDVSSLAPRKVRNKEELLSPLDQALKNLNRTFKFQILPEIKSRSVYQSSGAKNRQKQRKAKKRHRMSVQVEIERESDPLTGAMLERFRRLQLLAEEITVVNGSLPEGDQRIRGVVTIVEVEYSGRYVISIDKVKQLNGSFPRFSFPGGRVVEGESLSRTTVRESFEEMRLKVMALGLKFHFVATIPIYIYDESGIRILSEDDRILLLCTRISESATAGLKPGKEQHELRIASRKEIEGFSDRTSESGELLPNHRNYWFIFKLWKAAGAGKPLGDVRAS